MYGIGRGYIISHGKKCIYIQIAKSVYTLGLQEARRAAVRHSWRRQWHAV